MLTEFLHDGISPVVYCTIYRILPLKKDTNFRELSINLLMVNS